MTVPNATESTAGLGAALEAAAAAAGGLGASAGTGPALGVGAAAAAGCPGTRREGEAAGSVLPSGTPEAAAGASAGAGRLGLGAAASGLLTGWAGAGSFFTGSGACRGAWGSGADCCGPSSEAADAEASLAPSFSGKDGGVASSVPFAQGIGRVGADAELRRPLNDKVENEEGRGVAAVAGGGADGGAVPLEG